jgi:ATP-dependent RNA helicase DDX23/PRP28
VDIARIEAAAEAKEAKRTAAAAAESKKQASSDDHEVLVLTRYRQTIMFSATMPNEVEVLAKKYLRHPIYVAIGDRKGGASDNVQQRVEWCSQNQKRKRLLAIVQRDTGPFMVFANEKKTCDSLANFMLTQGISACAMHGGKVQSQREAALVAYKRGDYDVIIGTDVLGRGIDIRGVAHVINYDMPMNIQIYTHRIGRTGRGGAKGVATSFLTADDTDIMYDLTAMLQSSGAVIPSQLAQHDAARNKGDAIKQRSRLDF